MATKKKFKSRAFPKEVKVNGKSYYISYPSYDNKHSAMKKAETLRKGSRAVPSRNAVVKKYVKDPYKGAKKTYWVVYVGIKK